MDKTGCVQAKNSLFIWEINNFSNACTKVGEYIESPFFTAGEISSNIIKWQIVLYPFGQNDNYKDYLSIFLVCLFCGDANKCDVCYKFYLWNNELGANINSRATFSTMCTRWGCAKFISRTANEIRNHLSLFENDTLKIACHINNVTTYYVGNNLNHQTELMESFDPLFLSESFSDVTIEIDNKQLKAHKNILAVRSEVFSAMFKHNTVENKTNVIRITDIRYDVMKEVLRFMYCGKVTNLQIYKKDLLAAANKYNLILLKKICEQSLWNNVNVNNVLEFLNISELYGCDELKSKIITFIANNVKELIDSPGFNQLTDSNPKLLLEILRKVVK